MFNYIQKERSHLERLFVSLAGQKEVTKIWLKIVTNLRKVSKDISDLTGPLDSFDVYVEDCLNVPDEILISFVTLKVKERLVQLQELWPPALYPTCDCFIRRDNINQRMLSVCQKRKTARFVTVWIHMREAAYAG